jgi:hypothetical protein
LARRATSRIDTLLPGWTSGDPSGAPLGGLGERRRRVFFPPASGAGEEDEVDGGGGREESVSIGINATSGAVRQTAKVPPSAIAESERRNAANACSAE